MSRCTAVVSLAIFAALVQAQSPPTSVGLGGCRREDSPTATGSEETAVWTCNGGRDRATIRQRFTDTPSSRRWEIEITGDEAPWSAPIEASVSYPATRDTRFWTAWDQPPGPPRHQWNDPLQPSPLRAIRYTYGGPRFMLERPAIPWWTWEQQPYGESYFSVPLVTWIEPGRSGISLVVSPEPVQLDLEMAIEPAGKVTFTWHRFRISKATPIRLALDIVRHEDDWRGGLRWMVSRYPASFDPPNPAAHDMAGAGAYSAYDGNLEVAAMRQMAFSINWRASFDFPYMGLFLPPVKPDEPWTSFNKRQTSQASMEAYNQRMRAAGFHVLSYFNVTEFGTRIVYPPKPTDEGEDVWNRPDWRDPNQFLFAKLGSAVLRVPDRLVLPAVTWPSGWEQTRPGGLYYTWERGIVMDPGEPVYRDFLLDQARRHLERLPGASGFTIDRMDWLRFYNLDRDDGISWFDGAPARFQLWGWHQLMDRLGPLVHGAGKVIFVNPMYKRLDALRQVDGIFDEMGDHPPSINGDAIAGLRKPLIVWRDKPVPAADADAYFQRLLYLGAFPMVPYPANDHGLDWGTEETRKPFLDYGPLLAAIRGRRWVLEPHAIEALASEAKVNLFEVAGGYVAPVTFGGQAELVNVRVRALPLPVRRWRAEALYPGDGKPVPLTISDQGEIRTPLRRGCALVRIRKAQ